MAVTTFKIVIVSAPFEISFDNYPWILFCLDWTTTVPFLKAPSRFLIEL